MSDHRRTLSLVETANEISEASAIMGATVHRYWALTQRNRGQIVLRYHAQQKGRSEGDGGAADGLVLVLDKSDMSWQVADRKGKVLIKGSKSPYPTVMAALDAKRGRAWDPKEPYTRVTSLEPG